MTLRIGGRHRHATLRIGGSHRTGAPSEPTETGVVGSPPSTLEVTIRG